MRRWTPGVAGAEVPAWVVGGRPRSEQDIARWAPSERARVPEIAAFYAWMDACRRWAAANGLQLRDVPGWKAS